MKLKTKVLFGCVALIAVAVTLLVSTATFNTNQTTTTSTQVQVGHSELTTTAISPLDHGSKSKLGYVIVTYYSGQQGAAVRALGSLQCLAGSYKLPVKILEPFAVGSWLTSDFPPDNTSTPLKFGDLFDLQYFNKFSQQEAEPTLASWNDFLENAPRDVISISTYLGKELEFQLLGDVKSGTGIRNLDMDTTKEQLCFSTKYTKNEQLSKLDFCVVRIVHLTLPAKKVIADNNLYEYLYGDWDPRHTTLVFNKWICTSWIQNPNSFSEFNCSDPKWDRIQHRLLPSKRLLKDSQFYTKQYLRFSNEIAMMVRSEHLLLDYKMKHKEKTVADMLNYFSSCLHSAIGKAHENTQADVVIYLTLDMSTFGSVAIPKRFERELLNKTYKILQDMVAELYGNQLSLRDWENRFVQASGGIANPAYIAALQRTIASQSNCLILVGGGSFQMLATYEYLRLHSNPGDQCVHTVCLRESFKAPMNADKL